LAKKSDKTLEYYLTALNNAAKSGQNYFLFHEKLSHENSLALSERGFRVENFEDQLRLEHTKISF